MNPYSEWQLPVLLFRANSLSCLMMVRLIPGWVLTERQLRLWANDKDLASHMEKQCIKEHLVPNDLIDSTLFLASDASRMMTGQALVIDGGVVVTG